MNFHRYDLGKRSIPLAGVLTACDVCDRDFRKVGAHCAEIDPDDLRIQSSMLKSAESGRVRLPNGRLSLSPEYFPVLHQLMKAVAIGRRSHHIRRAISRASGLVYFDPFPQGSCNYVEDLGLSQRRATLRMCVWLLDRWPRRFVNFCADNGIWESWILKDFAAAPRWFYDEVHRNLYRPMPEQLVDYSAQPG